MATLHEVVHWCDRRTHRSGIRDFPGAENGLQVENSGAVTRIGAAVDAGLRPFEAAAAAGVDFLIVHHGLFWRPPLPIVGPHRKKLRLLFDHNIALYGSHLPLDCHPEIGNNVLLARALGLVPSGSFLEHEGTAIGTRVDAPGVAFSELVARMAALFPETTRSIACGPESPHRIGILTGSGQSAVPRLHAEGIDTFITGELKQEHFNFAQEWGLNLLLGGHYATETFGVCRLAEELAAHFDLPWTFLPQPCPL